MTKRDEVAEEVIEVPLQRSLDHQLLLCFADDDHGVGLR